MDRSAEQSSGPSKNDRSLIIAFSVIIVLILVMTPTLSYLIFKKKFCKPKLKDTSNVSHLVDQGNVLLDLNMSTHLPGIPFGSLQRQRTISRKFSAKSRLSSTLTEQYFQSDIVYDAEWEVQYDSLTFESLLGEGAFGRVMKGISDGLPGNKSPTTVAIKMLKGKHMYSTTVQLVICTLNLMMDCVTHCGCIRTRCN